MPTLFIVNGFWKTSNVLSLRDMFPLLSAKGLSPFPFLQHDNLITVETTYASCTY